MEDTCIWLACTVVKRIELSGMVFEVVAFIIAFLHLRVSAKRRSLESQIGIEDTKRRLIEGIAGGTHTYWGSGRLYFNRYRLIVLKDRIFQLEVGIVVFGVGVLLQLIAFLFENGLP